MIKKRSWTNWSKHEADGIVDDGEVAKAINKIDSFSGNKARSDYINNNRESYFAELHKLLIDVFGNLTITID